MKFKVGLLILLLCIGQSLLTDELEPIYQVGSQVEANGHAWTVEEVEYKKPPKLNYSRQQSVQKSKIIYTFKRPIIPYFLNKQFTKTQKPGDSTLKFRKTDSSFYKVTTFGSITLGGVSLLALYGFFKHLF